jgi:hypothetical protein
MKVMTRTALKKIEKAGGKRDDDGSTKTPVKTGMFFLYDKLYFSSYFGDLLIFL